MRHNPANICVGLAQESKELSKRISAHVVLPKNGLEDLAASNSDSPLLIVGDSASSISTQAELTSKPNANSAATLSRKRTYSTPYPFEAVSETPRQSLRTQLRPPRVLRSSSVIPPRDSPVSSTPSRIPKPAPRARSSSQSSGSGPLPNKSIPTPLDSGDFSSKQGQAREVKDISDLADSQSSEKPLPISQSDNIHDTVMSQAQFEHWYRGEGRDGGGRNGGRGEIRAGTQEMLAIALSGHAPADYHPRESWAPSAGSLLDDGDYSDSQERWRTGPWAQDSVLDERMLTDMEGDAEGTDADTLGGPKTPVVTTSQLPNAQSPSLTPRKPTIRSPQTTPTQSNIRSAEQSTSRAAPSTPRSRVSSSTNRGRPTPRTRKKTNVSPSIDQSASRSTYDLSSVSALADAIPHWESSPPIPPSGNWDEVVLPTIAKKMRIAQGGVAPEVTMLGSEPLSEAQQVSPTAPSIPPAPGTFAYNASKAHLRQRMDASPEMDQFGLRQTDSSSEALRDIPLNPIAHEIEQLPTAAGQPLHTLSDHSSKFTQELRNNKPSIRVISPSLKSHKVIDDQHGSGCCKCVIM